MTNVLYTNPVSHEHDTFEPSMGIVNGMKIAMHYADDTLETVRSHGLSICDVTALQRKGVKGTQAANGLEQHGISIPDKANSWQQHETGALILRLGNAEYLIEDTASTELINTVVSQVDASNGLHPVPRNDAAFIISGAHVDSLFSQVCAVDLLSGALDNNRLMMTSMAGVSVTILMQTLNGETVYRLWCDGSYGTYLWHTLLGIIEEQGGGPVGFNFYYEIN
jgi:sarcosine oxidase subunit gamma